MAASGRKPSNANYAPSNSNNDAPSNASYTPSDSNANYAPSNFSYAPSDSNAPSNFNYAPTNLNANHHYNSDNDDNEQYCGNEQTSSELDYQMSLIEDDDEDDVVDGDVVVG